MQYVASTVGFAFLLLGLVLHVVANFSIWYSETDGDSTSLHIKYGVWGFCVDPVLGDEECENLVDDPPDWLKTVQILMGIGTAAVVTGAVMSSVQFVLGCCTRSRRQSKPLMWLILFFAGIGGVLVIAACGEYGDEYKSIYQDIVEELNNLFLAPISFLLEFEKIEDDTSLAWAFYVNVVGAVLITLGAALHLVDMNAKPRQSHQTGTVLTSTPGHPHSAVFAHSAYPPAPGGHYPQLQQTGYPSAYPPAYPPTNPPDYNITDTSQQSKF